jgi:endonuclease YncB( thermonuclease family)
MAACVWLASGRLLAPAAFAEGGKTPHTAVVTRVVDGDTVSVRTHEGRHNVRLAQIDAPERDQPHGRQAAEALARMVLGREVRMEIVTTDRYGRDVVELFADGVHVNRALVREGHAWVYQRYAVDRELQPLESAARSERLGLWALPEADRIPPWAWRAAGRAARQRPRETLGRSQGGPYECGAKTRCAQMASCEEAVFHLRQCGVTTLDGDGDGVPCEALCSALAGEGSER